MRIFLVLLLVFLPPALADSGDSVTVDLPLVDAPFNFLDDGYMVPSMRQSLAVSSGFYESAHRAIMGPQEDKKLWKVFVILGFDIATSYFPLGDSWMHEEWHRAVMSRRGISSYNDVNNIPIGQELIAVSHVTDEDLVRLKRDHPAESVRMSSAGMESQIAQNLYIERNQFFNDAPDNNRVLFWLNNFSVIGYLTTCSGQTADSSTDKQNTDDGSNIPKRDFTGLDCTGWVYDLFRPDEPYTNRGVHPSGNGIDRYIRWSDLNDNERDFLKRQMGLSYLNLIDPNLLGFNSFKSNWFGEEMRWNARLSHALTSFGYVVDAHLMLRWSDQKFHFKWHNGFNDRTYFPGLSLSWIDFPLTDKIALTLDATLWNQPRTQRYNAHGGEMLVAGGVELGYKFKPQARAYVGVEAKTPGWMMGQVFLDRAMTVWTGLRFGVF
jgi:hypothetical protein